MKKTENAWPVLQWMSASVCAGTGFPSPADDYLETGIDWNQKFNAHAPSIFTVRVMGESMMPLIMEGDMVIVDKSFTPRKNDIVIAIVKGEFTLKRWVLRGQHCFLVPENESYSTVDLRQEQNAEVWGVVTHIVRSLRAFG